MNEWWKDAYCAGLGNSSVGYEIFFSQSRKRRDTNLARAICGHCKVREECLEENLMEHYGIWGGTSRREREIIRANRRAEARCA